MRYHPQPRGTDPERHGHRDRRNQRAEHESHVLAQQPREVRSEGRLPQGLAISAPLCAEKLARDGGEASPIDLRPGVEARHRRRVDASFEPRHRLPRARRSLGQPAAMQKECVVARKEAAIVLEHAYALPLDLGVGGVDVDPIDAPRGDRFVREAMVERDGFHGVQPVCSGKARPAILASEELVRKAQAQLVVAQEVGEFRESALLGERAPDADGVGVLEAERDARLQSHGRQPGVHLGEGQLAVGLQYLARDRPGILGVRIDRAIAQGFHENRCVSHAGTMRGRRTRAPHGLDRDLAQDVRLGEALRAHAQLALRAFGGHGASEQENGEGQAQGRWQRGNQWRRITSIGSADLIFSLRALYKSS